MRKFIECVIYYIFGILGLIGYVALFLGLIVFYIPAYILDVTAGISYVIKKLLSRHLQLEFEWWNPWPFGTIVLKFNTMFNETINDIKKLWLWLKKVC